MSTVNWNGGLGGFRPKFPRREPDGGPTRPEATPGAKATGDQARFRTGSSRLTELAGDLAAALSRPDGPAADLVRSSRSLGDLIEKALARNLGRTVRLGAHRGDLERFVAESLRRDGYPSFEELKHKVG